MLTCNSLSGGKTSSFIAVHYPADFNVFSLVRTNDKNCLFPDSLIRKIVSDKIGLEFIGTLEDDKIIYTLLDLEQFIGKKIDWVSGETFDEIINRNGFKYLPNVTQRFCTSELKIKPIFNWWKSKFDSPIEMRIGFRANEQSRAQTMLFKTDLNGCLNYKVITGKYGTRNKWSDIPWQKPSFPLIKDKIFKDKIEKFWSDKNVRFAFMNNCVGCFHRDPILLKKMSLEHPNKFDWFINQEGCGDKTRTFKNGITYQQIKNHSLQFELFDEDFNDCDSGFCTM